MCLAQGKGYARIRQDYEDFYTRRMYYRIHVCPFLSCCPLMLGATQRSAMWQRRSPAVLHPTLVRQNH